MKTQKMTKQVKAMVERVNEYLRDNHIKDMRDCRFCDMCWLLSAANCYHGFNFFTIDGRHSGGETEDFDHLELYIC